MTRFYERDLGADPIVRSHEMLRTSSFDKAMDMNDRTLAMVVVNGIGAHLTNDEKRAQHLIDQVCAKCGGGQATPLRIVTS
jgi:hypothetical protein